MLVNLKTALAARRIRQVDLAISIGISPSVFSEIITGRRTADPALRVRIAKELGVDESWLFTSHISKERGEAMNTEEVEKVDVFEVSYSVKQRFGEFGEEKKEFGSVLERPSRKIAASTQEAAVAYVKRQEVGFSVNILHVKNVVSDVLITKRKAVAA
jgi:transcriptional regulator with XRE-family HTH domain